MSILDDIEEVIDIIILDGSLEAIEFAIDVAMLDDDKLAELRAFADAWMESR